MQQTVISPVTGCASFAFNLSKSICVVFGKSKFNYLRWYLKGLALPICDSVKYLGVVLSNGTDSHSSAQKSIAHKSIQSLDTAHRTFLKAAIGISKSCRTTPLLDGLNKINKIYKSIKYIGTFASRNWVY